MATDAALIDSYRGGNVRALEQLMARHRGSLMGFFVRRVGDDAEELHQELWTKVERNLDRYRDDGRFRAFLFAAARRLTIDHHRRRSVRPKLVSCETLPAGRCDPDDLAGYRELVQAVESALSQMNPNTAAVVRLRLTEQLTFAEIAEMRGQPLNTVLSYMHRGLKQLRRELDERGVARMEP
jgi:RNA polymerase sigma factor (sigma-70 family)